MPVVDVGVMRMGMDHRLVTMRVRMRLAWRFARTVGVLVVFVVGVEVVVFHRLMPVLVLVSFCEMQPDAQRHEDGGEAESAGELVA